MSLDTELDTLIARARRAEAPPPHARAEVRRQLAEQLRRGFRDPDFERAVLPAPLRGWPRAASWGLPAGVLVGAAVWLALRLGPQTAEPLLGGSEPGTVLEPAGAPPAVTAPVLAEPEHPDVSAVQRESAVEHAPARAAPARTQRTAPAAPRPAPRAPAAGPDLLAESQALARVQQALRDGQHEQALRLLGEQEREFSRGVLHEERAAARALALCGGGERAAGERAAAAFAARYPGSVLRARVQSGCASRGQAR